MCNFDDVIEDGAPTGSEDPEYARGFRYGQEYGLELGMNAGVIAERSRIVKSLRSYFDLTQELDERGVTEINEEWDRGFQAAIAIVTNQYNHLRQDRP